MIIIDHHSDECEILHTGTVAKIALHMGDMTHFTGVMIEGNTGQSFGLFLSVIFFQEKS